MENKKVFILSGGNGIYNIGDDAMFEVLIHELVNYNPNITIFTDSSDLKWKPKVKNIKKIIYFDEKLSLISRIISLKKLTTKNCTYYTKSLLNYIRIIKESDYVYFSGSGGINDRLYKNGILRWGLIVLISKIYKKPVKMSSQGIGPLKKRLNKFLASSFLKKVDLIEVREKINSKKLLISLGVNKLNIKESPDNAVLIKDENQKKIKKLNLPRDFIIFNIHKWRKDYKNERFLSFIERTIRKLNSKGYCILLLSSKFNKKDDDRKTLNKFYKELKKRKLDLKILKKKLNSNETKTIVDLSKGVIASRYHLCLFGLTSNKACVPIIFDEYYKNKMEGLLDWYNLQFPLLNFDNPEKNEERIINLFDLKKIKDIEKELERKNKQLRSLKRDSLKNFMIR